MKSTYMYRMQDPLYGCVSVNTHKVSFFRQRLICCSAANQIIWRFEKRADDYLENSDGFCSKKQLAAHNAAGVVDLLHRRSGVDYDPIDKDCSCYACARYSRSHLYHLFKAKSSHAQHLVALHNLHYTVKSLVAIMEEEPELARRVRQYFPADEVSPPGGDPMLPLSPPQVRRWRMALGVPSSSRRGSGKESSSTGALRREGIGRRRAERGRERRRGEKEAKEGKVGVRTFRRATDRSKIVNGTNRFAGVLTKWERGASEGEEDEYESSGSYFDFDQPLLLITPESSTNIIPGT